MNHLLQKEVEVFSHQTSKAGKAQCGDSYYFTATDEYFLCVLADGLGSGKYANEASSAVAQVVEENKEEDVETLMKLCNQVLLNKRGAAVAVVKAYFKTKDFVYSCVGNIRFYLYSPTGKLTYPLPVTGYLSGRPQLFSTHRYPFEEGARFLIHSDGLRISSTKSLLKDSFSLEYIAQELERSYSNAEDDLTFIVGSLL
ncbi:PP2C family serine/threonine-protein phosphatase [Falsibacillus pallidus]|uniref:Negative regulator of sigma-B (Phosphoserine phosphatase) n=1 Tax=Falsibacillus pallidus TaxID=493781 RepID=A0A370G7U3_9BACI|nr:PP2C family serine/threonine-protein phosphatase [Falsibacillus pallidus]RDI39858.1 negative regulator of sigma-B (phosphoserine phosphatase) [Falsibacillus pallidus]